MLESDHGPSNRNISSSPRAGRRPVRGRALRSDIGARKAGFEPQSAIAGQTRSPLEFLGFRKPVSRRSAESRRRRRAPGLRILTIPAEGYRAVIESSKRRPSRLSICHRPRRLCVRCDAENAILMCQDRATASTRDQYRLIYRQACSPLLSSRQASGVAAQARPATDGKKGLPRQYTRCAPHRVQAQAAPADRVKISAPAEGWARAKRCPFGLLARRASKRGVSSKHTVEVIFDPRTLLRPGEQKTKGGGTECSMPDSLGFDDTVLISGL